MQTISATVARNEWSETIDRAIRQKPQFIKRTRDELMLCDLAFVAVLLEDCTLTAHILPETDGSITLSLQEIDLIENAPTLADAKLQLAQALITYANDYWNDLPYWHSAPNRRAHLPYVMKTLVLEDAAKIGAWIQCPDGRS